jgi:hypothetical protein
MINGKQPHILNASSNLLGICFVLVTGLKLTKASDNTWADEISLVAALALLSSCVISYLSMRSKRRAERYERVADYLFLFGLFTLSLAVVAFARDLF